MKDFSVDQFAAIVGIDWADKKHDLCEFDVAADCIVKTSVISSQPESIHEWAASLRVRYPHKPVAIACELKKGPLVYALMRHEHIVLFPLHPRSVAKYRETFSSSGAKSDTTDAELQQQLLRTHMSAFSPMKPEAAEVRALTGLVESRRKLVQSRVKITNSMTSHLKNYFPQALEWFEEKGSRLFSDFITRWSTLAAAKRARKQTVINFMHQHNVRSTSVIEARITAIRQAVPLTEDEGVTVPNRLMVQVLAAQLNCLLDAIGQIDEEISQRYRAMADREVFDSFPAAGPSFAPRLCVAFGSDRERFQNASELQMYAGIAPVIKASGQSSWTHWRYACPKFLRQTFVEWAGMTPRYSFWARAYYEQQQAKGKEHNTIIRALAFKWIRIMFRCWKEQKPYDDSRYLQTLKDRGSPLIKNLATV